MLHPYVVTIAPKYPAGKANIVLKIGAWEDTYVPANKYTPPDKRVPVEDFTEGVDQLTIKVGKETLIAFDAGHPVNLTNKRVVPAGGYLIVATNLAETGINLPTNSNADDNAPLANERSPAELKYNAIPVALPNLEGFLANGGTIDLVSPNAGLIISEIMWGSDASLATNSNSQWIEIKNTTAADIKTGDATDKLIFYGTSTIADVSGQRSRLSGDARQSLGARGFFRQRDAAQLGVHSRQLQQLVAAGSVERVARGLYRLADMEPTEHYTLAAVCARVPNAIVCLLSALSVHGLGTQLPWQEWIAIPHKARAPQLAELPVKIVRFSGASLQYLVVSATFEGVPTRITSPARTVVDCFRFPPAGGEGRGAGGTSRRPARPQGNR